jgi:16S rRNA (guanine(527)-N(7))-methyltransferase RsmG
MPDIEWIDRVARHGVVLDARQVEQLTQYGFLLRTWSSFTALVSSGNLAELESLHFVDSLSLVDVVRANTAPGETVLDIGTGGGFPAIPLAVALTDRKFVLMERSAKKVSFLRKVMGALGLGHVSLIHGSFPDDVPEEPPVLITARAVERSDGVLADIADILPEGCVFLCQSGDPTGKLDAGMFHVEHFEDEWTRSGDRRGSLDLVRLRLGG